VKVVLLVAALLLTVACASAKATQPLSQPEAKPPAAKVAMAATTEVEVSACLRDPNEQVLFNTIRFCITKVEKYGALPDDLIWVHLYPVSVADVQPEVDEAGTWLKVNQGFNTCSNFFGWLLPPEMVQTFKNVALKPSFCAGSGTLG